MAGGASFLVDGPKGLFVLFDYGVSILALVVNILVLISVLRCRINLTGYKWGLASLGISNLYLCFINTAIFVIDAYRIHGVYSLCWGKVLRGFQISGLITNLFNLSYISLDHLIGIVSSNH